MEKQEPTKAGKQEPTKAGKQEPTKAGKQRRSSSGVDGCSDNIKSSASPDTNAISSHKSKSNASKVAIPRLHHDNRDPHSSRGTSSADKNRVAHACEPCRQRKTKCSGERPVCQHCQDFRLDCVYVDGKRDKTRKQIGRQAGRIDQMRQLLERLSLDANTENKALIRRSLDEAADSDEEDSVSPWNHEKINVYPESQQNGEDQVTARVGSTESLDKVDEDFNKSHASRATGFHGKNSELTWVRSLQRHTRPYSVDGEEPTEEGNTQSSDSASRFFGAELPSLSQVNYHCDDLDIWPPYNVDPTEDPPKEVADVLFHNYMDNIHPAIPILGKKHFYTQYERYFTSNYETKQQIRAWRAILNLIFAIAAKYSHLVQAQWRGDPEDHLVFFTRARLLGFDTESILGHAELQKVQIAGLMSFYLMATNQINRAWTVSGIAVRQASALGLSLRNESKDIKDDSKEIRNRVWWVVSLVERNLAVMTGRPTAYSETHCTAPLPLPFDEESFVGTPTSDTQKLTIFRRSSTQEDKQSDLTGSSRSSSNQPSKKQGSPSHFAEQSMPSLPPKIHEKANMRPCNALAFGFNVKLSAFTNEVLNRLYRADAVDNSWAQVQSIIADLNAKLKEWRSDLPTVFDFNQKQRDQEFVQQRMCLGFGYYSILMIINRPCLCCIDRKIPNESDKAKSFNRATAAQCVHAAQEMLSLLPDAPNAVGLCRIGPWWCLVHYLMQAAIVLMLELSIRADHMPSEAGDTFSSAKKALQWLQSMSHQDIAAYRAATLCFDLLRTTAQRVGIDADDVPVLFHQNDGLHLPDGMQDMQFPHDLQSTCSQSQQPMLAPHNYTSSAPCEPQLFATYDQFLNYDNLPTTAGQDPFVGIYPNADDHMQGMPYGDPGLFPEPFEYHFPPGTGHAPST